MNDGQFERLIASLKARNGCLERINVRLREVDRERVQSIFWRSPRLDAPPSRGHYLGESPATACLTIEDRLPGISGRPPAGPPEEAVTRAKPVVLARIFPCSSTST